MHGLELEIGRAIREAVARAGTVTGYREPLIGLARADDTRFGDLRQMVSPVHLMPEDLVPNAGTVVSFFLLRVIPGNPARLIAGPLAPDEAVQGIVEDMGLDQPMHIQYFRYISDFFNGDWGFSFSAGRRARLPNRTTCASRPA